eukprot:tig00000663_g2942.t1
MTLRRFSLGSLGKQDIRLLARLRSQNFSFSRYHPLQRSASEKDLNRLVEAAAPRSARTRDGARKPRRRARSLPAEPGKELPTLLEELRRYYERGRQRSEWVYTQKDLLLRESIRFDPGIAGILSRFWRVTDEEGLGRVSKAEYLKFHNLLYKALNKHFDAARAAAVAEEDWELDSGAHDELNADRFRLSLFEMADAWAGEVTAGEYARVLEIVFERITYLEVGPRGTRRRLRYRALEEVAAGEAATVLRRRLKEAARARAAAPPRPAAAGAAGEASPKEGRRARAGASAASPPSAPPLWRGRRSARPRPPPPPRRRRRPPRRNTGPQRPAPRGALPPAPRSAASGRGAVAGEAPSPLGPHALPGQKVASAAAGFKLKLPLPPAIAPPPRAGPPPPSPPPSRPPRPAPAPLAPAPRHPSTAPPPPGPRRRAASPRPPAPGPVIRPLSAGTGRQSGRAQLLARAGGAAAVLERGGCLPPGAPPPTRIPPRPCSSFPGARRRAPPAPLRLGHLPRPPTRAPARDSRPGPRCRPVRPQLAGAAGAGGGGLLLPRAAPGGVGAEPRLRDGEGGGGHGQGAEERAQVAALERQWRAAANLPQRAREAAERLAPAAARLVESLRLATRAPLHTLPPPPRPSPSASATRARRRSRRAWRRRRSRRRAAGRRAGPRPEEDVRDVGLFLAAAFDAARAASPPPPPLRPPGPRWGAGAARGGAGARGAGPALLLASRLLSATRLYRAANAERAADAAAAEADAKAKAAAAAAAAEAAAAEGGEWRRRRRRSGQRCGVRWRRR